MCSDSEAGSFLRLIDYVYHSTLGWRVIKKNNSEMFCRWHHLAFEIRQGNTRGVLDLGFGAKGSGFSFWIWVLVQKVQGSGSQDSGCGVERRREEIHLAIEIRQGGPRGVSELQRLEGIFFCTLVTGPRRSLSLKLSDTRVYEPQIRARLGTTANFCEVVVLKLSITLRSKSDRGMRGASAGWSVWKESKGGRRERVLH